MFYEIKGLSTVITDEFLCGKPLAFGLTDNFSVHCSISGHPTIGEKRDFIGGGRIKIKQNDMIVYTHSGWFGNITKEEALDIAVDIRDYIRMPFKITVV